MDEQTKRAELELLLLLNKMAYEEGLIPFELYLKSGDSLLKEFQVKGER